METAELLLFISTGVIFLSTVLGCIGPMFITAPKWTSRLESLAAGVFLGAGLAHLLDDAFDSISEWTEEHPEMTYPLAPAICVVTFVLLTLVELFSYSEHDAHAFESRDEKYDSVEESKVSVFGANMSSMNAATISLYFIMCAHSVVEGLALGISQKLSSVIAIFCAIVGHKPVEAFALALILLKCRPTKCWFLVMVTLYSVLTPIGILSGMELGKVGNPLVLGIVAAFSSGTFLFVGCHEWSEMFEHKHTWPKSEKCWHFSAFSLGALWMLLIAIVEMYSGE